MRVTMMYGKNRRAAPLTADELETWGKVFRSTFGPKQALVDELREAHACDKVIVCWDGCMAEFRPDGTLREELS